MSDLDYKCNEGNKWWLLPILAFSATRERIDNWFLTMKIRLGGCYIAIVVDANPDYECNDGNEWSLIPILIHDYEYNDGNEW